MLPGIQIAHPEAFTKEPLKNVRPRLDALAARLLQDIDTRANIIAYAGRRSYVNEAKEYLALLQNYLVKKRGIAPKRIALVDGGYNEDFRVEIYLSPLNALLPAFPRRTIEGVKIVAKPSQRKTRHRQ